MKLDAGNPNLKKRIRKDLPAYVHIPRDPDVVPAPAINIWEQPVYKLPGFSTPRPGADDHLKFKSVGNLT